jgi:hypothetical protein
MSLPTFCLYLGGFYVAYYGLLLLTDLLLRKKTGSAASSTVDYALTAVHSAPAAPVRVSLDDIPPAIPSYTDHDDLEPMHSLPTDLGLETISDEGIEVTEHNLQQLISKPHNH